jgi:hypothetical protein
VLIGQSDQRRGPHLADFARASADKETPGPFIGSGWPRLGVDGPRICPAFQ